MSVVYRVFVPVLLGWMVLLLPLDACFAQQPRLPSLYQRGALQVEASRTAPAARIGEIEPNNTLAEAQDITGPSPLVVVDGSAEVADAGDLGITFQDGAEDDFEDLFSITTTRPGLSLVLEGFTSDCDLWLLNAGADSTLAASVATGATTTEQIIDVTLPPGTYIIGVSIFDLDPQGSDSTAYTLTVGVDIDARAEIEPNNVADEAQPLLGIPPLVINGSAEVADDGDLTISFQDGTEDDLEDLFLVETSSPGLRITLGGFTSDCDLWLVNAAADSVLLASLNIGPDADEAIDEPSLPAGAYIIGVSIFDPDPAGPDTTAYTLTVLGDVATAIGEAVGVPETFVLGQNYPNPFNPETRIAYALSAPAPVRLAVFDLMGRTIRTLVDAAQPPGTHTVVWDGRNDRGMAVASGVYLYRLQAGAAVHTRTLVVLR